MFSMSLSQSVFLFCTRGPCGLKKHHQSQPEYCSNSKGPHTAKYSQMPRCVLVTPVFYQGCIGWWLASKDFPAFRLRGKPPREEVQQQNWVFFVRHFNNKFTFKNIWGEKSTVLTLLLAVTRELANQREVELPDLSSSYYFNLWT